MLRLLLLAGGVFKVRCDLDGIGADLIQLLHPEGDFQAPELVPEDQVLFCFLRLSAQGLHLELQFVDLVVDAHQILFGALQLPLSVLLAVTVAGDAGGLLKNLPAVGALDGQDLIDLTLSNDGVALPAQPRVHKQLVDILEPDGMAVDVVFALPRTVIPPGDHDLALLPVEEMPGIVQHQRDLCKAQLLPPGGAAEDDVLHLAAPERLGGLLPHHPADGVGNIGFSAAVWPHDGGDIVVKGQHCFIRKGFESLDLQRF